MDVMAYNEQVILQLVLLASILTPVVSALVEVVKKAISLPKNILPVVAIIIGLAVAVISAPFTPLDIYVRLWAGAFAGLGSVGLFEATKFRPGLTKE
jgi:hypothetical protein